MQLVVLGTGPTVQCFALAGVKGNVVTERRELERLLETLTSDLDVGAIMIEPAVAELSRESVERAKRRKGLPLVVELPRGEDQSLEEMLRRSVGF